MEYDSILREFWLISGSEKPMDNDTDGIPEVTLGEILQEEFLQPMGISVYRPAKDTAVPVTRISEILEGAWSDNGRNGPSIIRLLR